MKIENIAALGLPAEIDHQRKSLEEGGDTAMKKHSAKAIPVCALVFVFWTFGCVFSAGAAPGDITTVAGGGSLFLPSGVFVDGGDALYIADTRNHRIRKVDASGIIATVAGNGIQGYSGDGGPATDANLNSPNGVFVDGGGNLYIADNPIRRVDAQTDRHHHHRGGKRRTWFFRRWGSCDQCRLERF